jgi:hypothetical protein
MRFRFVFDVNTIKRVVFSCGEDIGCPLLSNLTLRLREGSGDGAGSRKYTYNNTYAQPERRKPTPTSIHA